MQQIKEQKIPNDSFVLGQTKVLFNLIKPKIVRKRSNNSICRVCAFIDTIE